MTSDISLESLLLKSEGVQGEVDSLVENSPLPEVVELSESIAELIDQAKGFGKAGEPISRKLMWTLIMLSHNFQIPIPKSVLISYRPACNLLSKIKARKEITLASDEAMCTSVKPQIKWPQ